MKEIKLSEENYKALLKSLAIGNFIYWIMADIVNDFYKKDAHDSDEVIHQVLKCCDDPKVKDIWDGKNVFTEEYENNIWNDIQEYENYVVEDLTGIDVEELNQKIDKEMRKHI